MKKLLFGIIIMGGVPSVYAYSLSINNTTGQKLGIDAYYIAKEECSEPHLYFEVEPGEVKATKDVGSCCLSQMKFTVLTGVNANNFSILDDKRLTGCRSHYFKIFMDGRQVQASRLIQSGVSMRPGN